MFIDIIRELNGICGSRTYRLHFSNHHLVLRLDLKASCGVWRMLKDKVIEFNAYN